jgi:hypothetical protein
VQKDVVQKDVVQKDVVQKDVVQKDVGAANEGVRLARFDHPDGCVAPSKDAWQGRPA